MINPETLHKIAQLSRIYVTEKEAIDFSHQLSKALGFFEKISEVDTSNIEPLVTPIEISQEWRADKERPGGHAEEVLANAPEKVGNLFRVPPVV